MNREESSEDEFSFDLYNDSTGDISIQSDSSNSESDFIGYRRKKLRVLDTSSSSGASDEDTQEEDVLSDDWVDMAEDDDLLETIQFDIGSRNTGPQISESITEPVQFFKLFFTDELANEIVKETNAYARTKIDAMDLSSRSIWHNWRDVEIQEFWAFLGLIINMGTMPLANMQEYWTKRNNSKIPFFSQIFSRDRFFQIFWMLHLKKNLDDNTLRTRIQKASNFLEYINDNFSKCFIPKKNICVDESVVKFKGKICFITYNPNKPTKWGIRIYVLADSETGYVYNILPYFGSITTEQLNRPDLPVSTRIPLHLYQKILQKIPGAQGYHMFTDRYYTSLPLADELLKVNCHLTGTIMANRKGLPSQIKKPKFTPRKVVAVRKYNNKMLLAWKDKRVVTMMSTSSNAKMTSITRMGKGGTVITRDKPNIVLEYTKSMGGVDRADQYASSYCFLRKSLKWWRKLFFWGMEICSINSYIIYKAVKTKNNEKPLSHLKYLKVMVDQLVGEYKEPRSRPSTSADPETRLNQKLHILRSGPKRDCVVCSKRAVKGGRRETSTYCDTCPGNPRMHLGDCFEKYHTLRNYKN